MRWGVVRGARARGRADCGEWGDTGRGLDVRGAAGRMVFALVGRMAGGARGADVGAAGGAVA